ncbi:MAG: hypothetical protein QOF08_1869 [Gaiellales bacterium]|nr:hypothetical protein [Gaiellales bacterium]
MSDRTTTPILATMVAVVISAAGCGGQAAATPVTTQPAPGHTTSGLVAMPAKKIVAIALRAARHERSVRVRITSTFAGGYLQTDDTGPTVGSQVIRASSLRVTVRVVGTTAYVKVDHTGGESFIGLANVAPARYLHRWISYRPGDPNYRPIATAVTMPSLLRFLAPKGALSKSGTDTVGGQPVVCVWGGFAQSRGCLDIATTGKPLPVQLTLTTVDGSQETITFSRWGARVGVSAPASATPVSALMR